MSSSAQVTQTSVRFVCVYASSIRFLLSPFAVWIYFNPLQNTAAKLFRIWKTCHREHKHQKYPYASFVFTVLFTGVSNRFSRCLDHCFRPFRLLFAVYFNPLQNTTAKLFRIWKTCHREHKHQKYPYASFVFTVLFTGVSNRFSRCLDHCFRPFRLLFAVYFNPLQNTTAKLFRIWKTCHREHKHQKYPYASFVFTVLFTGVSNRFSRCLDHCFRSFRSPFDHLFISIDYKTLEHWS